MKKSFTLQAIVLLLVVCSAFANSISSTHESGASPMCFTENRGQWDEDVRFRCDAGGAIVWICKDRLVYQFLRKVERADTDGHSSLDRIGMNSSTNPASPDFDPMDKFNHEPDSMEQLVITARFADANPNSQVVGNGLMEYKCNYLLGNDPKKWHMDVPNYQEAVLQGAYEGVDLRFFAGVDGRLTYQYDIASTANAAQVKLEYDGLDQTSVPEMGERTPQSKWGEITGLLGSPKAAAELTGLQPGSTRVISQTALSENRSPQAVPLVYSTYLGGSSGDIASGIAVDRSGNAYVTGYTGSTDFPTQNAYDASLNGNPDVFVSKLSSSGNSLIYSTYLGGSIADYGYGIAVDDSGNAFVTGLTESTNFPTQNAYDASYNGGGYDVFVSKLSSSGSSLLYSTYLGGSSGDWGYGIAVDSSGNAYVTGSTTSTNFPTQNAFDASYNGVEDAFLTKLSSSGNSLIYSTFLGGSSTDRVYGIAVDSSDNAYVTGWGSSNDFPTQNAFDASYNGGIYDVFVSKLSSSGSSLIYSTYLGGSQDDRGFDIDVDGSGNAYVTGSTLSTNFPTQNAYDASLNGNPDVFVSKLSSSGNSLIYSTYLGGSNDDAGNGIAVDSSGNAYVTGVTYSTDFPTQNAYDASNNGNSDVFVSKLSSSGSSLIYSTYLGGSIYDWGYDIAVDDSGNAYVPGNTYSTDFPTQNAYDASFNGGVEDVFVTKLGFVIVPCGDADGNAIVTISDAVYLINYIFSGGPAPDSVLAGDADCNNIVTISDAVYLINYIFSGGPAPCAACP